jgi:hypothetical protein
MSETNSSAYRDAKDVEALERVTARLRAQFPELAAADVEAAIQGHYEYYDGRPTREAGRALA